MSNYQHHIDSCGEVCRILFAPNCRDVRKPFFRGTTGLRIYKELACLRKDQVDSCEQARCHLRKAKVAYFRLYDLRSTHATRLSAGGGADEWVTQMLRQTDAKVFKKYSQMKLQMKREALTQLNRGANEPGPVPGFDTVSVQ